MLKPIQRDQTVSVISVLDPAIDIDRCDMVEHNGDKVLAYALQRSKDPSSWRKTVQFRDGEAPTEFVVGIIPSAELARIEDECNLGGDTERQKELGWRCFLHCLTDIQGGFTLDGAPRVTHDGVSYIAPVWLRSVFVGGLMRIAIEIGTFAWLWNKLGGDDAKN